MQKGDALERAVHSIESAILQASPALRESSFLIESKKILVVAGVRHEIDIYVTVNIGPGYGSVFLFECKNWEAAVGKNEIIVFSEKISAAQAQRGFFVAKSFTSDARAQASKDPRMQLLEAVEHNPADSPMPIDFHFLIAEITSANLHLRQRGSDGSKVLPFDPASVRLVVAGVPHEMNEYIRAWALVAKDEHLRSFPSGQLSEGNYVERPTSVRSFSSGEFLVDGRDIAEAKLDAIVNLKVVRPPVVSHYEVATRGRVLSLAPVSAGGAELTAAFVST